MNKNKRFFSDANTYRFLNENLLNIFLKSYPECFDDEALISIMEFGIIIEEK